MKLILVFLLLALRPALAEADLDFDEPAATPAKAKAKSEPAKPAPKQPAAIVANDPTSSLSKARDAQRLTFTAGSIVSYKYAEPGFAQISGPLYQVGAGYHRLLAGQTKYPLWWEVRGTFSVGELLYSGGLQNIKTGMTTPLSSYTYDTILDVQGLLGIAVMDHPRDLWNVYLGAAIWNLTDDSTGSGAYSRNITYAYIPVGTEYIRKFGNKISWKSAIELNAMLIGIVRSNLSEADSDLPDTMNQQPFSLGGKIKTSGEWAFEHWTAVLEIYYQYWNISVSSTESVTVNGKAVSFEEPANTTNLLGATFGVRF